MTLLSSLVVWPSEAACDFAGAEALTGVTAGLSHNLADGDAALADGQNLVFTCNSAPPVHDYLDDTDNPGATEFLVACTSGNFVQPSSWPYCIKKCTVPSLSNTAFDSALASGELMLGNTNVDFTCANSNAYIVGTVSDQSVTLTCPDDTGIFPEQSTWGVCEVRCVVPAPEATYDAHPEEGNMVVGGTTVDFACSHAHGYVTGTSDRVLTITCDMYTGLFPTGWDACEVKCSVPDPEDGYAAQVDADAKHAVGTRLTYTCSNANGYVDGTADLHEHNVDCLDTGLFQTGWPSCINKCTVPTAETGYDQVLLCT